MSGVFSGEIDDGLFLVTTDAKKKPSREKWCMKAAGCIQHTYTQQSAPPARLPPLTANNSDWEKDMQTRLDWIEGGKV